MAQVGQLPKTIGLLFNNLAPIGNIDSNLSSVRFLTQICIKFFNISHVLFYVNMIPMTDDYDYEVLPREHARFLVSPSDVAIIPHSAIQSCIPLPLQYSIANFSL